MEREAAEFRAEHVPGSDEFQDAHGLPRLSGAEQRRAALYLVPRPHEKAAGARRGHALVAVWWAVFLLLVLFLAVLVVVNSV